MGDRNIFSKAGVAARAALVGVALLNPLAGMAQARPEAPVTPRPPMEEAAPGEDQIRSFTAARRDLTAEEFRKTFENKTAHLSSSGMHYGSEYYMPGDRSLWIAGDGPCRQGTWTYESGLFCFRYAEDGPYCWRVFESAGVYYAESMEGLVLRIYAVEQKPLTCDPELYS